MFVLKASLLLIKLFFFLLKNNLLTLLSQSTAYGGWYFVTDFVSKWLI